MFYGRLSSFGSMTQYYLEELLKRVQNRFVNDKEKCAQLVHLEWMFRNVLEWEDMRCTQKFMKDDPSFYAELVCILYRTDDNEPVDEERRKLANNVYEGFEKAKFCPAENDGYVIYQELKNWVTKFYDLLCRQNRQQRFESLIGRLLPYSPIGWDGYSPCEAVRKIIEEYDTGDLKRSYVITEESKRGVYTVDAGKPELEISDRYRKNAEGIREKYPKTAEIYYALSDTKLNEAVGPHKIMPPELERVHSGLKLDYRPSDVYLFSKVLWMTLKEDNIGYRGKYQRGDMQICLNKEKYREVKTFEPIHRLMEEATCDDMLQRIAIDKCIEYLEEQLDIIDGKQNTRESKAVLDRLLYDEYTKEFIASKKPKIMIYEAGGPIYKLLKEIFPCSDIYVKLRDVEKEIRINISSFLYQESRGGKFVYYNNGRKIKEYVFVIKRMIFQENDSKLIFELKDINMQDQGFMPFSKTIQGIDEYKNIYFSSKETIVVQRRGEERDKDREN